jgi:heme/copper-type cytochrome/quinol oxidase subunit 3
MNDINYDELQERVQKGMKRQKAIVRWTFLGVNIMFFLIFLILLIAVQSNPASPINSLPESVSDVLILPLILWPMGIMMQFMHALMESGVMDKQIAARVVGQELGNQILENQLQAVSQKRKREADSVNDEAMTVSDDGELVPLHEADDDRRSAKS